LLNKKYKLSLSVWTLVVSLSLHAILLTAFAVTKISPEKLSPKAINTPQGRLNRVKKIIAQPKVSPKPKVSRSEKIVVKPIPASLPKTLKNLTPIEINTDNKLLASKPAAIVTAENKISITEFFGSKSDTSSICFVVDSSGSMQGIFSQVRENLKNSINSLKPDEYFYIIFFGAGQLYEFGNDVMVRASAANRNRACEFVDSIIPAGTTNAAIALEQAFAVRDSLGKAVELIYFLTDGFDLTDGNSDSFIARIETKRGDICPQTEINTIGFWTKEADCIILKEIAVSTGGNFTLIKKPQTQRRLDFEFE